MHVQLLQVQEEAYVFTFASLFSQLYCKKWNSSVLCTQKQCHGAHFLCAGNTLHFFRVLTHSCLKLPQCMFQKVRSMFIKKI